MSTVATVNPGVAVYREEQGFAPWVYAVFALAACVLAFGLFPALEGRIPREALSVGFGAALAAILTYLRMGVEVDPVALRVWYGWLAFPRRAVPVHAIAAADPVRFRPIRDHGGWGYRVARGGERVYTARGDTGVRIRLRDGSTILVGSQRPEELAAHLRALIEKN